MNIQKFKEKLLDLLPHVILLIFVGTSFIFLYRNNLTYDRFLELLRTLVWPMIVLVALLFFRKVFVYIFFSMEEFNFFGIKGGLKDIRKLIDEKVQERIQQEKDQMKRAAEISEFTKNLEDIQKSKDGAEQKAKENQEIAKTILNKYEHLSVKNDEMLNELNEFRRQKAERDARMAMIRQRIEERNKAENKEVEVGEDSPKADKPK
jgi:hypothetical protein